MRGLIGGALLLAAIFAPLTPLFGEQPRVAVTVYNDNLGLVREQRTIELGEGESTYSFRDVAALIDPTSVHLRPLDNGELEVLEQNYEYDLLSSDKLYQKYLEKKVELFFEDGEMIAGTLLSHGRGGQIIIRNDRDARISVVNGDQLRSVDLIGDMEGFVTRPTLVWALRNGGGRKRDVEVEYLTSGMSWHAEYVALADEANESIELSGWVSVDNRSGGEFRDARLKLMAGSVHRAPVRSPERFDYASSPMYAKGAAAVEERSLFEYHLYEVARPTTIRNNQVKQIAFVPNTTVPVTKEFLFEPQRNHEKIEVILEFENREKDGIGIALPAGLVRVFQDDGRGGSEFIGEDRIDHTPRNEKVRLLVGEAFDLVGEKKTLDETRVSNRVRRSKVEIRLRNRKEEQVNIKVLERLGGDWTIDQSSHSFRKEDARTAEWTVPVEPDGETVITYTVTIRW